MYIQIYVCTVSRRSAAVRSTAKISGMSGGSLRLRPTRKNSYSNIKIFSVVCDFLYFNDKVYKFLELQHFC